MQRREQAIEGLRGLLHSLSRVRHSAHRLPTYVARAYQSRLQHAVGWYRITTTELVERILHMRREIKPQLLKATTGELRLGYEPYLHHGQNLLLLIGRVDLAFAPIPAAVDPLLLLWFHPDHMSEWLGEGGVPPTLLAPSLMHSLLEVCAHGRSR